MGPGLYAQDGSYNVTIKNVDAPVELTGDIGIAQLDDIVTATEATQAAAEDVKTATEAVATATGTITDTSADATIIGLLTRIAEGVEALA